MERTLRQVRCNVALTDTYLLCWPSQKRGFQNDPLSIVGTRHLRNAKALLLRRYQITIVCCGALVDAGTSRTSSPVARCPLSGGKPDMVRIPRRS